MKRFVYYAMYGLCDFLDCIPRWSEGHWYRYGGWGCQFHIARSANRLEQRWEGQE